MITEKQYRIESLNLSKTQSKIIAELAKHDRINAQDLSDKTGIPKTTCIDNLEKLEKAEIVQKFGRNRNYRGRPKTFWRLKEDGNEI